MRELSSAALAVCMHLLFLAAAARLVHASLCVRVCVCGPAAAAAAAAGAAADGGVKGSHRLL